MAAACLSVAIRSLRERSAIRRGTRELPSQDGPAVLIGRIDTARPVVAPLDGRECVAYTYEVTRDVKSGRSWTRFVLYKGVGLAPSQIVTGAGTIPPPRCADDRRGRGRRRAAGGNPAALRALPRRDDLHEENRGRRRHRRRRARSALERQRWRLPQRHLRRQRLAGRARRLPFRPADRSPRRAGLSPGSLLDDPTRHRPRTPTGRRRRAFCSATRPRQAPSWRHEPACSSSSRPSSPSRRPGSSRRLPRPRVPRRTRSRGAKAHPGGLNPDTGRGPRRR